MITHLPPYPAYKPSGVDWLGDVPAHWELVQLGRIGRFSKGSGGTKADEVPEGVPCIRYGDLYTSHKYHIRASRSFVTEADASDYTPLRYGDILFAGSGETIEEIGKSAVNLIETQACCGGDVILFRPEREMDARFSGYATDCPQSQYQKSSMGRGITVMHIYGSKLKYLWIALPPLPEQTAIARYLDHADRRIQCYIQATQKRITLLHEARQAIIQRAVTRGLDPDVPLKPSGVDWLGDVPAHWEVARLKGHVANITDQTNECGPEEIYLALENVESWTGRLRKVGRDVSFDSQVKRFQVGDVLFGKLRPYLAKVASPNRKGVCVGEFLVLRCRGDNLRPSYLEHLMRSKPVIDAINASTFGAKMPRADWQYIGSMKHPVPPLAEQTAIAAHLDKATADIDAAIDTARRQAELMRPYRTSLIAHVVTGKLDVRAAAERIGMATS